jgi:tetratricopeptide (TPR) repeat protein
MDRALPDLDTAIRLDSRTRPAYSARGWIRYRKKEYDRAIADTSEAIRLDPQPLDYDYRGLAWFAKQEYDKAIADHSEAIRLDPTQFLPYHDRGKAWRAKKAFAEALADFSQAIRLAPKEAGPSNSRAWLRATCTEARYRDGALAVADATRACDLSGWKNAYYLGSLAAASAEAGDFARAVEFQEQASRLYAEPESKAKGEARLVLYKDRKPYRAED